MSSSPLSFSCKASVHARQFFDTRTRAWGPSIISILCRLVLRSASIFDSTITFLPLLSSIAIEGKPEVMAQVERAQVWLGLSADDTAERPRRVGRPKMALTSAAGCCTYYKGKQIRSICRYNNTVLNFKDASKNDCRRLYKQELWYVGCNN